MIRIAGEDDLEGMWCNPPAPSDYWCGEHTVKPNS